MEENEALITRFYTAFKMGEPDKMAACYAENVQFEDPAFGPLNGDEARGMWAMLIGRSKGKLDIVFFGITATENSATATWEAKYPFGKNKRKVHNKISAAFVIENGKIVKHVDTFDFHKWAGMAVGPVGKIFGNAGFFKKKFRKKARAMLHSYMQKQAA
jgi:ketosteroid isomerase-like protein